MNLQSFFLCIVGVIVFISKCDVVRGQMLGEHRILRTHSRGGKGKGSAKVDLPPSGKSGSKSSGKGGSKSSGKGGSKSSGKGGSKSSGKGGDKSSGKGGKGKRKTKRDLFCEESLANPDPFLGNPGYCTFFDPAELETIGEVLRFSGNDVGKFLDDNGDAIDELETFLDLVRLYFAPEELETISDEDILQSIATSNTDDTQDRQLLVDLDDFDVDALLEKPACKAAVGGLFLAIWSFFGAAILNIPPTVTTIIAQDVFTAVVVRNPNFLRVVLIQVRSVLVVTSRNPLQVAREVFNVVKASLRELSITSFLSIVAENLEFIDYLLIAASLAAQLTAILASGGVAFAAKIAGIGVAIAGVIEALNDVCEECVLTEQPTMAPAMTELPTIAETLQPTPPTETRDDLTCPTTEVSGGQGITNLNVDVLGTTGSFPVSYEMFTIPDGLTITYEGQTLFSTNGLVSGARSFSVTLPPGGTSTIIQATINAPRSGTAWRVFIGCVLETESPTNAPTKSPTKNPTQSPTVPPTAMPSKKPTESPTGSPRTTGSEPGNQTSTSESLSESPSS